MAARAEKRSRPWRSIVFAPVGEGATRRRGSDAVRVVLAVLAVLACWLITGTPAAPEKAVLHFLTPPPSGIRWLVNGVWWLATVGIIAGLGLLALLSRRRNVSRDVLLAGLVAWVLGLVLVWAIGPNGAAPPSASLKGLDLGFPIALIAATVAVATAALPYLSRGLQRVVEIGLVLMALSTVVHGSGLPISVLASMAIGWGVTAAVHLTFGSPLGLPSRDEVAVLLSELGLVAREVEPAPKQVWGVARFRARDPDGALEASVYGRDAADAQLVAKTLRFLAYRDSGPELTLTRLQQVEHEAYLTLLAERCGARAPTVVTAGVAGPSRDAVLVTRPPVGQRLDDLDEAARGERLSDRALEDVFGQLACLRRAGIAHGALSGDTILFSADGRCALTDFRSASSGGGDPERFHRDLAAALAVLAQAAGAERTVAAASRALAPGELSAALPFVQRAALSTATARSLRGQKALLADVRQRGAEAAGVEVPKLAEPRRISWVTLALVLGTIVGGWALIGVLINVGQSFSTIVGARWGWVAAVFVLSQLAYPALGTGVVASVLDPIPYGRAIALEFANTFVSLAGGTPAALATRIRFFQTQGYSTTLAVSSGVLLSTASWIVKGALFLIALPLAISSFHFTKETGGGGHGHAVWLIVVIVIAVAAGLGLVLIVPRLRRLARDKLRPPLADVLSHLKALARNPRKLVQLFAAQVAAQLFVALALGAALHAFNEHLNLAQLLIVLTLASMLGGVSPVPGGMGVVEAGMIFCLTAAGIPQSQAVAAVFVQRLFTAYLPPIWGGFVLVWMRRREYL